MIDYKDYPDNWFTEIRPAILKRANNCCEQCGCENHKWIWYHPSSYLPEMASVWTQDVEQAIKWYGYSEDVLERTPEHGHMVHLTIAHLKDPNPMNVEPDNLAALCQTCHLRYDSKRAANKAKLNKLEQLESEGQLKLNGF